MMTYAICGSCSTVVPAGYYHRCFVPTHAQREIDLLRAEVERMRAVVEAARLYVTDEPSAGRFDRIVDALDALDAASRY